LGCGTLDPTRGSLGFSSDDLVPGTRVQLMRRMVSPVETGRRAAELLSRVQATGRRPVLALYVDCAGRTSVICGSEGEDVVAVQEAFAGRVPLFGVYAAGEAARVGDQVQALN